MAKTSTYLNAFFFDLLFSNALSSLDAELINLELIE